MPDLPPQPIRAVMPASQVSIPIRHIIHIDVCPICGQSNPETDTFRCEQCQRAWICLKHRDPQSLLCEECREQTVTRTAIVQILSNRVAKQRREQSFTRTALVQILSNRVAKQRRDLAETSRRADNTLSIQLDAGVEMEFIRIPAGEFWMGSDPNKAKDAFDNEKPRHKVFLPEYWIGRTPVTNRQYQAFVQATGHRAPSIWNQGLIPAGKEDHPVVYVDWQDALACCAWLAKRAAAAGKAFKLRLPSEAEWEKAACGADGRLYPWGDQNPDPARCNFNAHVKSTTPAGHYSPQGDSPYGCVDMAGNVREWTASLYLLYPYRPNSGSEDLMVAGSRILRGGCWGDRDWYVRAAVRGQSVPTTQSGFVGFRCALSR
jgi:formylglycine-generating enzyme required for sulfatase activity